MISRDLETYILTIIEQEDEVLQELYRQTNLKAINPQMTTGPLQGNLLTMLGKLINPKQILEIGTYTGYSAICLAKSLQQGGQLYTIEINDELKEFSAYYFKKAGMNDRITQLTGDALKIIPTLDREFDLVFMDADKRQYIDYYHLIFSKVRIGGYILVDNVLWGGKVMTPSDKDPFAKALKRFNEMVKIDKRIKKSLLPVRDGLMVLNKIRH